MNKFWLLAPIDNVRKAKPCLALFKTKQGQGQSEKQEMTLQL